MAITYKVLKCKNPNGIDDVNYYSARAVKTGDYDFDDLADDLASMWGEELLHLIPPCGVGVVGDVGVVVVLVACNLATEIGG